MPAGSRYLVAHGGVADMCILGEPTESKVVLGHFGSLWLRISTKGPFIHTAFSEGKRGENSIVRMRDVLDAVLEWIPTWEDVAGEHLPAPGRWSTSAGSSGFGWRVSRTPHPADLFLDVRVPPTKAMTLARTQMLDMVRDLAERFPAHGIEGEVYVTAPGAEISEDHPLVGALDTAHAEVHGSQPEPGVTRWFSDASVLTRYGIATVNYGTSSGLLDTDEGREPRDRRARQDRRGLRPGGDEGLRSGRMKLVAFGDDRRVGSSTATRSPSSTSRRCASTSSEAAPTRRANGSR